MEQMNNSLTLNMSDLLRNNEYKTEVIAKADHLTIPVSNVLKRLHKNITLKNNVIQAFQLVIEKEEQSMVQNMELFQQLAFFAQHQPANLEGVEVDLKDVDSLNAMVLELLQPLSSVTLYRSATITRLRKQVVDDFKKKVKEQKVADKTKLYHLLKDANRCISAENRAKLKYNKTLLSTYPQNPLPGSIPKRSFSPREALSRSSKEVEWKESMQRAKWKESNKLKTKAIGEVCSKLNEINQNRCKDCYQLLKTYFDIELFYHSKALEKFSAAYRILTKWKNSLTVDQEKNNFPQDICSLPNDNFETLSSQNDETITDLAKYLKPSNDQSDKISLDLDAILKDLSDSSGATHSPI